MNRLITTLILIAGFTMGIAAQQLETATFGGGCFWCTEAFFSELKGVHKVRSGYSGGEIENPTYREVCTGQTGHAEVIQIEYDVSVIGFTELLEVFFATHDPTSLNRQGADVGTQYRSVILYHSEKQKEIAQKVILELNGARVFEKPIVTEVAPFDVFYEAEDYHQDYFKNNANQPYCRVVIKPKLAKFRKVYQELLKE
ncbi:peptide-methionine (S)-S-oxide reductase [Marinilabiliaceae bacterium JC017]|nr:peptide-methionine (S)-S-oxide reductase [Marinilabiliaceae bacterium JC017]